MDRGNNRNTSSSFNRTIMQKCGSINFKDSLKLPTAELNEKQEINPNNHFSFLHAGTGSQLCILERSLSAFQLLLHIVWCCALLIPSHLTVLQLYGERHMKPVLLRNVKSTTIAEVTFQLKRSHSYYQELIIFGELLLLLSGARSNGNHRESMVSFYSLYSKGYSH